MTAPSGADPCRPHGRNEAVAATAIVPNDIAIGTECLSQAADLGFEIVFADRSAWPDACHELILAHKPPVRFDQRQKEVKRARTHAQRRPVGEYLPVSYEDMEAPELDDHVVWGRIQPRLHDRLIARVRSVTRRWCFNELCHRHSPPCTGR